MVMMNTGSGDEPCPETTVLDPRRAKTLHGNLLSLIVTFGLAIASVDGRECREQLRLSRKETPSIRVA